MKEIRSRSECNLKWEPNYAVTPFTLKQYSLVEWVIEYRVLEDLREVIAALRAYIGSHGLLLHMSICKAGEDDLIAG